VADVIVCNGFVGNVVLKMLEGVSETVVRLARYAHKEKLTWRIGLMALSSARSAQLKA
jgi:glycerol-3-phosphate acyltransferase PlsX